MKIFNKIELQEAGASLVEYALLVALIASVSIAVVTRLGGAAANKLHITAIAMGPNVGSVNSVETLSFDGGTRSGMR